MNEQTVDVHALFSFISDRKFRSSLANDYEELLKALHSESWKAAHVSAGSVVEALLIDYLVSLDYAKKTGKDALELDLSKAIDACKKEGVLSDRASGLATVIRGYRNLIHPGRVIRLKEIVDKNSAAVAKALVDMVIGEVANARQNKYGLTADQIILKIEQDSSCLPILRHLLKDMSEDERERLLTDILPQKHLNHIFDDDFYPLDALEVCFRHAFELLADEKKRTVARRFVTILRQQPEQEVLDYEIAFFRATDMQYLDPSEVTIVREHLLSQLKSVDGKKLDSTKGLAKFLLSSEVSRYFSLLLRAALHERTDAIRNKARMAICEEYHDLNDEQKEVAKQQLEFSKTFYADREQPDIAEKVGSVITEMLEWADIPF